MLFVWDYRMKKEKENKDSKNSGYLNLKDAHCS